MKILTVAALTLLYRRSTDARTLDAYPASPNIHILHDESSSDLIYAGSVKIISNKRVTYQRYFDDQFLMDQSPLERNEAKVVITSDCDTSQTDVVPNVTWVNDGDLVTLIVDVPTDENETEGDGYLDPMTYYEAFWSYTGYWCERFQNTVVPTRYQPPSSSPTDSENRIPPTTTLVKTACLTKEECNARRKELGFKSFHVDSTYQSKGCFSKNENAFFGLGGSEKEMNEEDLNGIQTRIWCEKTVNVPTVTPGPSPLTDLPTAASDIPTTPSPTPSPESSNVNQRDVDGDSVCLTSEECDERRKELGFTSYHTREYPTHGCFYKNDKAYFGQGGTMDEISKAELGGEKVRIYCNGGTVPKPASGVSKSNALSTTTTAAATTPEDPLAYPGDSASLIEKAGEESTSLGVGSLQAEGSGPVPSAATRYSIPIRLVMFTFTTILVLSVLYSDMNMEGNAHSLFGFGKFAVVALAVSAAYSYPKSNSSRRSTSRTKSSSTTTRKATALIQSRSLQTCTYNVEVLMDGCRDVEIVTPTLTGRIVDVSIQDLISETNEDDECTTDYSANLTFPDTYESKTELNFTDGVARVASFSDERCVDAVEGRPFVDSRGHMLKASPVLTVDDSWSKVLTSELEKNVVNIQQNYSSRDKQQPRDNTTSRANQILLGDEWTRRALSEHSSIASFSAFSIALMTNNAPSSLVEDALKAGLDEIKHARVSFQIASKLFSQTTSSPVVVEEEHLQHHLGPGPLPESSHSFTHNLTDLAVAVAKEGCIDETLSALAAMAEAEIIRQVVQDGVISTKYSGIDNATLTWIQQELQTIALEESNHSALAWRTLQWMCRIDAAACQEVKKNVLREDKVEAAFHHRFDWLLKEQTALRKTLEHEWKMLFDIHMSIVFHDLPVNDATCTLETSCDTAPEDGSGQSFSLLADAITRGLSCY